MAKQISEKDVENKIKVAQRKLDDLIKIHSLTEDSETSEINKTLEEANNAYKGAKTSNNYDAANNKADEALKAVKKIEEEIITEVRPCQFLTWKIGWLWEIILAAIALVAMYFLVKKNLPEIPIPVFLWAILGAVAYLVFGIAYHYKQKDLTNEELLFITARIVQAPILAGAVYLVMIDLNSTQQFIISVNQTFQIENITPANIASAALPQKPSNILFVVSFFTGFFTEPAIAFLRSLAKKLLPEQPRI